MVLRAQTPRPAEPVAPISAIIEAFRSHEIVALGNVEGGNEQSHAFQLALIRDPRFPTVANDILVEFGNALYQDVVDRFVAGEDVPYESLRRIWRDTTQPEYEWDLPIYEEFFRAVREANALLPRGRQVRVLLGDPPIDWEHVNNLQDLQKAMGDRDAHAVEVLRREVLAKGRRALVIYGSQHLIRRNARGIIGLVEKDHLAGAFTILPETRRDLSARQADVSSWPKPSLAMLRGTVLGTETGERGGFDAVLYLGPPSSMTAARLSPALCSDRAYVEMRIGRLGLVPPPPGAMITPAERLKEYCARVGGLTEIPRE